MRPRSMWQRTPSDGGQLQTSWSTGRQTEWRRNTQTSWHYNLYVFQNKVSNIQTYWFYRHKIWMINYKYISEDLMSIHHCIFLRTQICCWFSETEESHNSKKTFSFDGTNYWNKSLLASCNDFLRKPFHLRTLCLIAFKEFTETDSALITHTFKPRGSGVA